MKKNSLFLICILLTYHFPTLIGSQDALDAKAAYDFLFGGQRNEDLEKKYEIFLQNKNSSYSFTKIACFSATALLLAKISYDLCQHSHSAIKAQILYQELEEAVHIHQVNSLKQLPVLYTKFQTHFHTIVQYHAWLNNSYNNSVTFWNWTDSQKLAFYQLKVIEILTFYSDLIALEDQVTAHDVVKTMQAHFSPLYGYPLIMGCKILSDSIDFIDSSHDSFCNSKIRRLLYLMSPHLKKFKSLLLKDQEYLTELQNKRFYNDFAPQTFFFTNNLYNLKS
jgi:hypothetical protein